MARMIDNPEYLQGQIHALGAIILGLANVAADKDDFRAEALERLERCRTTMLNNIATDTMLRGLDDQEAWLKQVTG